MSDSGPRATVQAPFEVRIAKVFADPLRIKILAELNTREMSPKIFYEEFGGGSLSRVCRHFDVLVDYDWLYLVEKKTGGSRRGATEHFYRATGPAMFDTSTWSDVPDSMKQAFTWRVFDTYSDRVKEAFVAGTIDSRHDRHFSWTSLRLDQRGWKNVIRRTDGLFEFLFKEQNRAEKSLTESGEDPISMTVALAAFESPKDTSKAP